MLMFHVLHDRQVVLVLVLVQVAEAEAARAIRDP